MTSFDAAAFEISRNRLTGQVELRTAGQLAFHSARYQDVAQHALGLGASLEQLEELRAGYEASVERC